MYLKKIIIQGFKSFGDKVEIELEKGITGIVGPNGSGKSNISDAVRWVLGEQSAKTLRGTKMEDIIFAGTTQRKPVGMAEVSLIIDNTSNNCQLPIEYSEIMITRRVYRSGESEYYINKSLCRLKDIREIFIDTGVGVEGYSIIGQGRIDEILSNKSGDRRMIFDEAAGIVKYKTRKEEAERKIENTNQNLVRIDDIIQELELRIEPLQKQCEKAKKFLELKEELKDLEINLFIHEMETLQNNIETLQEQQQVISDQLNHYLESKDTVEQEHENFKNKVEELDKLIHQLQNSIFETIHFIEKKDGDQNICQEKIKNIEENIIRLNNEVMELGENKEKLLNQYDEMHHSLKQVNQVIDTDKDLLQKKTKALSEMQDISKKQMYDMEESKGNIIEILNGIATKKSEINSLNSLQINMSKRQDQIQKEKNNFKNKKDLMKKNQEAIQKELQWHESEFKHMEDETNQIKISMEKLNHQITEQRNQLGIFKHERQNQQARKNLLEEMAKEYEGFHKSVRNTLICLQGNPDLKKGIWGVVAELIHVPKKLEIAIEVALGNAMQNIVCQTAEDANRVIDYLKKNGIGRVTFLPIESIKGYSLASSQQDRMKSVKGFIGLAIDQISFSSNYQNVIQYLLGRVILVDRIENGIQLAKKTNYRYKIVSLEGDVLNPGGSITGGSYHFKALNLLSRKRERKELENSLETLNNQCEEYERLILEKEKKYSELADEFHNREQRLKEMEIKSVNFCNSNEQWLNEIKNCEENLKRIMDEEEQLAIDHKETALMIQQKQEQITKLEVERDYIENTIKKNKLSYEEEKVKSEKLYKEVTSLKIEIASLEQKQKHFIAKVSDIEKNIKEIEHFKVLKQKHIDQLSKNKHILLEELKKLKIEINDNDILKQQYVFNLSQAQSHKKEAYHFLKEVELQLNKINATIAELQESAHKMDVKLTRLNTQKESYCNKLWEDYEITYLQALEHKKEEIHLGEALKYIQNLKTKIKNLGSINVHAIKEYQEVIERYDFLVVQKRDLMHAKESLNTVIKEMKYTIASQFADCFEKIRENFNEIFRKIFGGGKAQLKLENEKEILTTGIEIIVQPPGKKLQNLSLLSGGERALTAISLLFAILKFKPTSFCILDEIEAALDDVNVYRYADFLKEFSIETQFITITHRKGTMEAADVLYGVTMEEHGVSKLVSVKLKEIKKVG